MVHQSKHLEPFAYRVRVRASGLLINEDRLLLIKHKNIGPKGYLWSPPGGGVEFGQDLKEVVRREFKEELMIEVEVCKYLFVNEFIGEIHHAVELFFQVKHLSGEIILGNDPELPKEDQILEEVRFFDITAIRELDQSTIHNALHGIKSIQEVTDLSGLITFEH